MTEDKTRSPAKCNYHLVSSSDAVDTEYASLTDDLDDRIGIQARIDIADLLSNRPYDAVLRAAKVGSRRGKHLIDAYVETVEEILERVDEPEIGKDLEAQYRKNGADAYEAELTGKVLTMGLDIESRLSNRLDDIESISFEQDDLAAAIEFGARSWDIESGEAYGTILVKLDEALSSLRNRRGIGGLTRTTQQCLLAGLNVTFVGPAGGPDEPDILEDIFRGIASFEVKRVDTVSFEIPEETAMTIDDWYDDLRYDIASGRVGRQVVRPAGITVNELPSSPITTHFVRAVTEGLFVQYTEETTDEDAFKELWKDRITPHPQYDQHNSRRNTFPKVTLGRTDGRQREFTLSFQGPSVRPHIDDVPIRDDEEERAFVDLLERYLDAEPLDEDEWRDYVAQVQNELGNHLRVEPNAFAEEAMLRRERLRTALQPKIPPADVAARRRQPDDDRKSMWYREHWRTILSNYEVRTGAGSNIIRDKQELCEKLDPDLPADIALYYKLQEDIQNAWEHYVNELVDQLKGGLPTSHHVDIEVENRDETSSSEMRKIIDITIIPEDLDPLEMEITVYVPYSDVRIEGDSVPRATVSNVVASVLEKFGGILYLQSEDRDVNITELSLSVIRLYCQTASVESGDMVYFEEIAAFVSSTPGLGEIYDKSVDGSGLGAGGARDRGDTIYRALSEAELMSRLRDSGAKFHRKGSDDHESIEVNGDRYIAMELREGVV